VRALVVEEPFVEMDARAVGRVPEAMRTKCRDGSTVVVTTASTRDAFALADDCATLRAGLLVADTTSVPQLLLRGPPDIVVVTRNEGQAKGLIAALADEPEIVGVELDANTVKARGSDRIGLARATGRAVARSKVDVVELRGSVS
jgi:ABC-type multidrug transport system ATPase subunit